MSDEFESEKWDPPLLVDFLKEKSEQEPWLIEGYLLDEGLNLISGPQKLSKKTFTAFLMSAAIAEGKQLGPFKPSRQGKVLVLEEEGTLLKTQERWLALAKFYKFKKAQKNIWFAFRHGVQLDTQEWCATLVEFVTANRPVLVVFDNLSFMHTGNENSNEDMKIVASALADIRRAGTACVFLAHTSKGVGSDPTADIDRQVRGGAIISNAYDIHIAIRNYVGPEAGVSVEVRCRDAPEQYKRGRWIFTGKRDDPLSLDQVELRMVNWAEDEINHAFVCAAFDLIRPGEWLTKDELQMIWEVNTSEFRAVIDLATDLDLVRTRDKDDRYSRKG